MSTRSTLLGTAMPFAHLLGRGPKAARTRAEDSDDKRDDETQEEYEERKKREQNEGDQARAGAGRGRAVKAEDQGDDETDEEYEERKQREQDDAASRADDDTGDDDDLDMSDDEEHDEDKVDRKDAKATAARKRERARCRAIFASKHAEGRVEMAAHLAFDTSIGRRRAVNLLRVAPKAQTPGGLAVRMAGMENLRPGQDGAAGKDRRRATNDSWDAAAKRVGIRRG